jgi:hypothetical protein
MQTLDPASFAFGEYGWAATSSAPRPVVVVRFGSGVVGVKGGGAPVAEALENGANGVRVMAQVSGDLGWRPSGVTKEYHLQTRAGNSRKVGLPQTLEFRSLSVSEVNANHGT